MNLERDLARALERKGPAPGFAERVMARIEREGDVQPAPVRPASSRGWRAVAAGITLTVLMGSWAAHRAAERAEGERARDQVMLAMRLAGSKVRYAQSQVRGIGSPDHSQH
jgi:hypothetical protein